MYISPSEEDTWGDDWLGETEAIPPGRSRAFELEPGTYDLLATDCNDETMVETYGLDLSQSGIWELVPTQSTTGEVTLTVVNAADTPICYILISPSDSEEWGEDWLGPEEILQSGAARAFELPPGTYDLAALDCDQNFLSETYGVDINEGTEWRIGP